ncbi:MAG: hypothetical protein LBD72_01800 [Puniceicoccales bacterium]|nr:hypothetical protein [Puniceicoccales bacterium]
MNCESNCDAATLPGVVSRDVISACEQQPDESVLELQATYENGQLIVRTPDGQEFAVDDSSKLQIFFPQLQRIALRGVSAPCVTVRGLGIKELVISDGEFGCLLVCECVSLETVIIDNLQSGSVSIDGSYSVSVKNLICGTFDGSNITKLIMDGARVVHVNLRGEINKLVLRGVEGQRLQAEGHVVEVERGSGVHFCTVCGSRLGLLLEGSTQRPRPDGGKPGKRPRPYV